MRKIMLSTTLVFSMLIQNINAQTSTVSDGDWNTGGNWDSGVPGNELANILNDMTLNVDINIGNGANYIVTGTLIDPVGGTNYTCFLNGTSNLDIDGNSQFGGNTAIRNSSTLTIRNNDTLIVNGNFFIDNLAVLTIEPLGVLIIDGDLNLRNNSTSNIDGKIAVGGDLIGKNSATMAGDGNIEVDGTVDISNSSSVFGSTTGCTPGPCEYGSGAGLPIELEYFKVSSIGDNTLTVEWATISEINNDYFKIDVSIDGKNFIEFAKVPGSGTTIERQNYSIVKQNPFWSSNIIYLKLSQYDFDGQFKEFNVISIDANGFNSTDFSLNPVFDIYPNPGSGENINIELSQLIEGRYELQLLNSEGNLIDKKTVQVNEESGVQTYIFNLAYQLNKGLYIVKLSNDNTQLIQKYLVN